MTRLEALKELAKKVEAGETLTIYGRSDPCGLGHARMHIVTAYQGSLDAAKALHEAVLHEAVEMTFVWSARYCGKVKLHFRGSDIGFGRSDETPARAWLIAILRALIAQEESA